MVQPKPGRQEEGGQLVRKSRSRASKPKVRTGCLTCKIRRVKCDEQRPVCNRCSSTGRVCDGYISSSAQSLIKGVATERTLSPNQSLSLLLNPFWDIAGSEQERSAFHFFRSRTALELGTRFNLVSWNYRLLQASHVNDAVRYAAIALGSINKRLEIHPVLTADSDLANAQELFANAQYQKAIVSLRESMSAVPLDEQSIQHVLMTCFMFIVFEFMRGNHEATLTHLRSGLRIVYNWNARHKQPLAFQHVNFGLDGTENISLLFGAIDGHASLWLGLTSFEAPLLDRIEFNEMELEPLDVKCFQSVQEARRRLHDLWSASFNLRRLYGSPGQDERLTLAETVAKKATILSELETWSAIMETTLVHHQLNPYSKDAFCLQSLLINHKIALAETSTFCSPIPPSTIFSSMTSSFSAIVSLSTTLLAAPDSRKRLSELSLTGSLLGKNFNDDNCTETASLMPTNSLSVFSFDTTVGIIRALYFVTTNCSNEVVSRKALELLEREPWREGAWDSSAMARIARRQLGW